MMTVKDLKEMLSDLDDSKEVFIHNTVNPVGNIGELYMVELSEYSSFGENIDCIVLHTYTSYCDQESEK